MSVLIDETSSRYSVHLAAVRSKPHLGQPRIAGDDLEVQPEQRHQHLGVHRRARRRSGGAERDLLALQVVERLDRFVRDAAGRDFRVEAAEPVELARSNLLRSGSISGSMVLTGFGMPMVSPSRAATDAR